MRLRLLWALLVLSLALSAVAIAHPAARDEFRPERRLVVRVIPLAGGQPSDALLDQAKRRIESEARCDPVRIRRIDETHLAVDLAPWNGGCES